MNFPSGGSSNGFGLPYQFLKENYTTFKHEKNSGTGTLNVNGSNRTSGQIYNVADLTPQPWWGGSYEYITIYGTASYGGTLYFLK